MKKFLESVLFPFPLVIKLPRTKTQTTVAEVKEQEYLPAPSFITHNPLYTPLEEPGCDRTCSAGPSPRAHGVRMEVISHALLFWDNHEESSPRGKSKSINTQEPLNARTVTIYDTF